MNDTTAAKTQLEAFAEAYHYDTSYLREILEASPDAFRAFEAGMAMSRFREVLPVEAHFVARISAMLAEDCGPCTQLNLRMALEAGVGKELLETLIHRPEELPRELHELHEYALAVASGASPSEQQGAAVREAFGEGALAELAVLIAGSRIYPAAKRALLRGQHCEILSLEI